MRTCMIEHRMQYAEDAAGCRAKRLMAHQVVEEFGGSCDGVLGDLGFERHPLVVVPREQGRVERLLGACSECVKNGSIG